MPASPAMPSALRMGATTATTRELSSDDSGPRTSERPHTKATHRQKAGTHP